MDQINSFDSFSEGSSTDSSDAQIHYLDRSESVTTTQDRMDKQHGMNDEQFTSYVNYREQTLEFCEDYLALYTSNPEFQLDF